MRAIAVILGLLLLAACPDVHAQGFDWQASPRWPHTIPTRYVGLEVGSGYTLHSGSLQYIEEDLGLTCCDYSSGTGLPLSISLVGEQWVSPTMSVHASIGYQRYGVSYVTPSQPVPLPNGSMLQTEYVLDGAISYVTLGGGVSTRLFARHLTIGGGLRVMFYAGGSLDQSERVVAPDDYQFTGNPRSRERSLGNTFLSSASGVQVEPYLQAGYNIPLSYGFYLTPLVSLGIPLLNVTADDSWRMLDLGVRLRLMRGL